MNKVTTSKTLALGAFISGFLAGAGASAADLPSADEAPVLTLPDESYEPFFIKAGLINGLNVSAPRLYFQSPSALAAGVTTFFPAGVGLTVGNVNTLGVEAGYFVTRNISFNLTTGLPLYANVVTKGFNPATPAVPNGTRLGQLIPAVLPVTAAYHFTQLRAFQPYLGVGLTPVFSLGNKNGLLTNARLAGSVGLVLQAGADYLFDEHWGVSFDVKKIFDYAEAHASGFNIPGVGAVPAGSIERINFQPWLIMTSVVYRFGAPDAVVAKY